MKMMGSIQRRKTVQADLKRKALKTTIFDLVYYFKFKLTPMNECFDEDSFLMEPPTLPKKHENFSFNPFVLEKET